MHASMRRPCAGLRDLLWPNDEPSPHTSSFVSRISLGHREHRIDRVTDQPEREPEVAACALHSTTEIPPPPCSWTKKPKCRRRRHPTADECRSDNGGPACTSQQPHQTKAIPSPQAAANDADITLPYLPEVLLNYINFAAYECTSEAIPSSQAATDADVTMPYLPEDVFQHIHSRMKMRDAARAACVSRSFLRFWRLYPNLEFTQKTLAASKQPLLENNHSSRGKYVFSKARQVLEKHSGAGVTRIKLNLIACSKADIDAGLLDSWLRRAVKPGVADLALRLPNGYESEYSFPYSLLLSDDDVADTDSCSSPSSAIQSLHLSSCGFHPTANDIPERRLACSRSLSRVRLSRVSITGDELWMFLSSCFSLEQLDLNRCNMVASLRLPRVLRKLKVVSVQDCWAMMAVESDAPNLSTWRFDGLPLLRFTLGDSLETKELNVQATRTRGGLQYLLQHAGSNLPSIAPNLESLVLSADHVMLKAPPAITDRFKNLKHLVICLLGGYGGFCEGYDLLSVACFLDACVALETFILRVEDNFGWYKKYRLPWKPGKTPSQSSRLVIPGIRYGGLGNLRKATITGFCTAKSLVELTWHILETSSSSLQCLVLDTTPGYDRKRSSSDRCLPMPIYAQARTDAEEILTCVRKYVEPKVPLGIELKFLGPCSRCHAMDAKG